MVPVLLEFFCHWDFESLEICLFNWDRSALIVSGGTSSRFDGIEIVSEVVVGEEEVERAETSLEDWMALLVAADGLPSRFLSWNQSFF